MEISQAFVGEAGAAVEAADVGQRREVIVQQRAFSCLHIQRTVTETSCVGLEDGEEHIVFSVGGIISCTDCGKPKEDNQEMQISGGI